MAINGNGGNGFPQPILNVLEQKGFLERKIRESLLPTMVFRPRVVNPLDWFEGRIGETKTFTRRALIGPNITPLNPANNTGLDNGMTADTRAFEQWTATLSEWPGFLPTNILGSEAFLGDLYLDNIAAITQKAGSSLDMVCAGRIFNAYDSGDTFANTASSAQTTVKVDNVNGFQTTYDKTDNGYGAPVNVSGTFKLPVAIISKTTGNITALANVTAVAVDGSNVSYMQNGGIAFGNSGTLTLDASVTCAIGDRVVAYDSSGGTPVVGSPLNPVLKDGSYVVRPLDGSSNMITTAYNMTNTSLINPSVMIPYAVSVLKRRGVPKLSNGLYGCAIDSTLLGQFFQDQGFQRATATNWDRGRYFQDGVIAAGWGVEFTEATQVPAYANPTSAFMLRHGFVFGADVIAEHPFAGHRDAANVVAGVGDVADERWVDRIKIRSLAALDTLGQVIKVAYDYVGDFQAGTDKSSNPLVIQTSDYGRFKRGVLLQASSPF